MAYFFRSGRYSRQLCVKISRGFALVELFVVVAIIALIASVILAGLTLTRAKSADAAIKSSINQARAQAELYHGSNGNSYDPGAAGPPWVCSDSRMIDILASIRNIGGTPECSATANLYRISSVLQVASPVEYYCIDSTGRPYLGTTAPTGNACP